MTRLLLLTSFAFLTATSNIALAHCQIPCGIYDDKARFTSLLEHTRTIAKSIDAINALSAEQPVDYHSIARWTTNKEEHAQDIQDIAAQYFLTQRVKAKTADAAPELRENYVTHTTLLHQIIVAAMKTKQTVDVANVEILRDLIKTYEAHYFKEHGHRH